MTMTVGDLKALIQESSNEFKAKLGHGVKDGNEKNNGKAYDDAKKRAKDYDGGLADSVKVAKYEKIGDDNRTTLDYEVDNVDDNYKKRIAAQAEGYTSVDEKENGIEKLGDYSDNKDIFDAIKKSSDEDKERRLGAKKSGLAGRTFDDETFEHGSLYESNDGLEMRAMMDHIKSVQTEVKTHEDISEKRSMKTAYFKKTTFLTEGHMMSRIPDEFKVEENVFRMKDKTGNEYIIEWKNGKGVILSHKNKQGMNESIDRMKALMGYKSSDKYKTSTSNERLNEDNDAFKNTLDKARKIIK